MNLIEIGQRAKTASTDLIIQRDKKHSALLLMASELIENKDAIIAANEIDIKNAKENGMSEYMIDRLMLNESRIEGMAKGVLEVAESPDPTNNVLEGKTLYNGINMQKVTVPLGVIAIIYESRPNVTSDCAALCIKAGSAVILRGGKEAFNSNIAISDIIRSALKKSGLNEDIVQIIKDTSRETSTALMGLTDYVDVLIPRGGAGLIKSVVENSKVPVIETGVGNCHVFIDDSADLDMACEIIYNAKCSRPSVCNAAECLLVHKDIAEKVLPKIKTRLDGVTLKACERTRKIIGGCEEALEEDFYTEYLDYILSVKIVDSLEEAISHINKYSSHHSEAIVTENYRNSEIFVSTVDSAAVYVNASTRFTDGGEFGFGAEIGISTQKLHARGPMGLSHLVSYKYILRGNGQIR